MEPGSSSAGLHRFLSSRRAISGWKIIVLANTGRTDDRGEATLRVRGAGWTLDPHAGSIAPCAFGGQGKLAISLAGRQTLIFAGRAGGGDRP